MLDAASQLGLPFETVILGFCLLVAFPLAGLFSLIPEIQERTRHWFSILTTAAISVFLFSLWSYVQMLGAALFVYAAITRFPSSHMMPVVVMVSVMLHLSYVQLCTQFWFKDDLQTYPDISAPVMVLVIKLSSFAWSVYDGTVPDKKLHPELKTSAIRKVPDLVEYLGFVFFFAGFWVGPAFEYEYYHQFTRRLAPYDRIPSTVWASLRVMVLGLLVFASYILLDRSWGFHFITTDRFYTDLTLFQRIVYIQVTALSTRLKLYAAWKISESAGIMTGLGYNGKDAATGKDLFDRLENVNMLKVELAENPKMLVEQWNKKTAVWLKRCVYLRVTPFGQKPNTFSAMMTYATSALWHGFFPGYYLSFLSSTFYTMVGRIMRAFVRPLFVAEGSPLLRFKRVYDVLGWCCTLFIANYLIIPFHVKRADYSIRCWQSVYFIGHAITLLVILVLKYMGLGIYLLKLINYTPKSKND